MVGSSRLLATSELLPAVVAGPCVTLPSPLPLLVSVDTGSFFVTTPPVAVPCAAVEVELGKARSLPSVSGEVDEEEEEEEEAVPDGSVWGGFPPPLGTTAAVEMDESPGGFARPDCCLTPSWLSPLPIVCWICLSIAPDLSLGFSPRLNGFLSKL